MSDVFISYARSDIEKAKALAGVFEQQGWSVWWDSEIPPGRSFDEVIDEALGQSKSVVVLWSKASVSSDWVRAEASEGREREILVPVFIEEVKVPLVFRRLQTARLAGWNGDMPHQEVDKLIRAIGTILGHPGVEEKRERKRTTATHKKEEKPKKEKKSEVVSPIFRPTPDKKLSESPVKAMLKNKGLYDSSWNKSVSGFSNDYKLPNNGKVVFDRASGLTWQQSGPDEHMMYEKTVAYITKLNSDGFAGYYDWRLPTLEEAMSLMEPSKKNGDLYIDSVFDKTQRWIWTSDLKGASVAWVVDFNVGNCDYYDFFYYSNYVRAVR